MDLFHHVELPKLLFEGTVTPELIESVRASTLRAMTFEGVVFKGDSPNRTKAPIMFKQKSWAWLDKLKQRCGDNRELFDTLK